jgi:hypothetical protein
VKSATSKLDLATLKALRKEAALEEARYTRLFNKHDNSDDMREMESWQSVVVWLDGKIGDQDAARKS